MAKKGMRIIEKYLSSCGITLEKVKYYTGHHSGGRSFYNDGTYWVEVFQIGDSKYFIHNKVTGRPAFYLYEGDEFVTARFSQRDFCEVLKELKLGV